MWRPEQFTYFQLLFLNIPIFLTMIPKGFNIIIAQLAPIECGHVLQPFDRPIDIIPGDQPLCTLLYKKIETGDQEQRNRSASQKHSPVTDENSQPRAANHAESVKNAGSNG